MSHKLEFMELAVTNAQISTHFQPKESFAIAENDSTQSFKS